MASNGVDERGGMGVFERRLLLALDAKSYGSADAGRQRQFQKAIVELVDEAADAAVLDRAHWMTQEGGDSLFAVLPRGASEPALVDPFMRRLDAGLRAFNRDRMRHTWLRLRAAVHNGPVSLGANGIVDTAPVEISRILDSSALRDALTRAPDACLAVALSEIVFRDVVQQGYTTFRTDEFRQAWVDKKEYQRDAWIWVPGGDVQQPVPVTEVPQPVPVAEVRQPAPTTRFSQQVGTGGTGIQGEEVTVNIDQRRNDDQPGSGTAGAQP
ncbi:hypothetical protein AB0I77_39390 [Streptomyces sp. NPDC050619]|uniref:hypothetical protein n=1 Tax=Streptomyces sp. NPDC050619 TaxID=3157214 RepID=UPI00343A53C2